MASYNKPTESLSIFNSTVFSDTADTTQIPYSSNLNVTVDDTTALNLAIPFLQTGGSFTAGDYQTSIDAHFIYDPSRNALTVGNISGLGKLTINGSSNVAALVVPNGYLDFNHSINGTTVVSQNSIINRVTSNAWNGSYVTGKIVNMIGAVTRLLIDTNFIINLSYDGISNGFLGVRDSTYNTMGDLFTISSGDITSRIAHVFHSGVTLNSSGTSAVLQIPNGFINMNNQPADDSIVSQSCINMRITNAANATNGRYKLSIGGYTKQTIDTDVVTYIASSGSSNGDWTIKGWDSAINGNYVNIAGNSSLNAAVMTTNITTIFNKTINAQSVYVNGNLNTYGTSAVNLASTGSFNCYCNTTFSNAGNSARKLNMDMPIQYTTFQVAHTNSSMVTLENSVRHLFITGVQGSPNGFIYLCANPFEGQILTIYKTQATANAVFFLFSSSHYIENANGVANPTTQFDIQAYNHEFVFSYAPNRNGSSAGTWYKTV